MKPEWCPLEWSLSWGPDADGDESHTAGTPFGSYTVEKFDGRWKWKYCFDEYYDEDEFACDSLVEGKRAAQDNWNERVAPIVSGALQEAEQRGRQQGLEEAIKIAKACDNEPFVSLGIAHLIRAKLDEAQT